MRLLNILCIVFTFNIFCYSQVKSLSKTETSQIVFLNDPHLKSIINIIMKKDSLCQTNSVQWSIEFIKNNTVLVTKYSLENLISTKGITNIYTTIINDKFLFLSSKENIDDVFTKSRYSVHLSPFIDKGNFSTIDYSFWVIQKKDGKKYEIVKEKKYVCND